MNYAVQLTSISKRFGSVLALDQIDLSVEQGTMHAVVGENGAGKTTLMKVLYGAYPADSGSILVNGQSVSFRSSADANSAGIGMVSQHYGIISELSCLQNLVLGAEGGAFLNLGAQRKRAEQLASKMGFKFDWDSSAASLSPSGAQKLEILKLLWREAKIMILDEPTAMLSPADADALFVSLNSLVGEGATVILVTHRLPEVMTHCSRVTVLRGGKLVAERQVSETSDSELAQLIVGEGSHAFGTQKVAPTAIPTEYLQVRNLVVSGERGNDALRNVSLDVRAGEIVGIAGVDGNGQRELFSALLGISKVKSGKVLVSGVDITDAGADVRIAMNFRSIPEDRLVEAVMEDWTLELNSILGLQRTEIASNNGGLNSGAIHSWSQKVAAKFSTKHGGLHQPMASLSGGNQQRFVAGRALESSPKLLLAFQPARGLDIRGTLDVYSAIRECCELGMAALVVSFDLDELLTHCDRILVLNHGELFEPDTEHRMDRDSIGCLMVGAQ